MLNLNLQYFSHLMQRANSLEKNLMLAKIEGKKRRGQQRMRWLDGITDSMDASFSKLGDSEGQGSLACYSPLGRKGSDMTERLTETTMGHNFQVLGQDSSALSRTSCLFSSPHGNFPRRYFFFSEGEHHVLIRQ